MKYIGENAIKKLISLIKGDLATKQDSIAATGVLERDTTGVINGVETVGATLVETQEAKLVDVPNGLLKGDGTTISAAVAGTDYVVPSTALNELPGHIANGDIHVTAEQKTAWNGSVRYDAAQTLTDAQKTQARANIAAAPSRFGLGENMTTGPLMQSLTEEALDTTYNNGWYFANGVNIAGFSQATIRVDSSGRTIYQTAYVAQRDGYVLRRCLVDTVGSPPQTSFGPWEWVDPPMQIGVEYRTTERYLGKPVYIKTVDTGALPNATYKEISASFPNANRFLAIYGSAYKDSDHLIPLPCLRYSLDHYDTNHAVQVTVSTTTSIIISTNQDMSSFTTSSVCVKYTKSTD